ncbi:hypothetical protein OBRU01_19971 [Operophtera brumata]|uniref:Uncharacterized protein n=1 Tax=Operophtera brumata TaxID=104452 RepID=A0A0L7KW28_OPEBR|nr:hypothetical protein OBRU01_19971 [Operophtera brumata]
MNGIVKSAHRVLQSCLKSPSLTSALGTRAQAPVKRDFTRGIWHMSSKSLNGTPAATGLLHNHSNTCSCGCGLKALHTKGERELVEFLTEEIVAERKAQKLKTLPTELEGFAVKGDGAEGEAQTEKQEFSEMRSRPQFEVDVVRGDSTLGFTCSFLNEPPTTEEFKEKGVSNDFVQKLSDFSTAYEHTSYINLLESVSKFTIGK